MKQARTINQASVMSANKSVISNPIHHSGKGGSSLKVSRQTMFHIQSLPAAYLQGLDETDGRTN